MLATLSAAGVTAGTPPLGPAGIWGAWSAPAAVVLPLLLVAGGYLHGMLHLARRTGRRRAVAPWRGAAFAGGLAALAVALVSPVDALAHELLAGHMVQHLLLLLVAPILLVLGRPSLPLGAALGALLGDDRRRLAHRLRPSRRWRRLAGAEPLAALAWAAHSATVLLWHVPLAYEAALRSPQLHAVEHVTMLGSALAAWWTALRPGTRRRRGTVVLYVTATAASGGLLAALLTFSAQPWYPGYRTTAPAWGLTPLQDQQLAGALMWVVGGASYLVVAAVLFAAWIGALEGRRSRPTAGPGVRTPVRGTARWGALVAGLAVLAGGCTVEDQQVTPEAVAAVERGRAAVVSYGCVACHQVPGMGATSGLATTQGRVGPPLSGMGSRQTVAGQLPNTPENLARWVQVPQEIDPGNIMPNLGVSDEDAADIAAFLGTLE